MRSHWQIPADAHCLVSLLYRLGLQPGPVKAIDIKNDIVNIWFVLGNGADSIARVSACLVRGVTMAVGDSPRRVYVSLSHQNPKGEWVGVHDNAYTRVGLLPPYEYGGWKEDRLDDEIEMARNRCCAHGVPWGCECFSCDEEA
jgi:hypothetical protein